MWFIGVEVEQETSAPPPKKNPGSAPAIQPCSPKSKAPPFTEKNASGTIKKLLGTRYFCHVKLSVP